MGSPCVLHLYARPRLDLEDAARAAIAEVERLEAKYSRYRPDSTASEINRSAGSDSGIEVDAETAALLDYAATAFAQSEGRFDISSGILRLAWNFRSGRLPEPVAVRALLPRVGWQRVRWKAPRLALPEGMQLDFGGYVKEYAADRVSELCRRRGVSSGLVDLGGDLAIVGPHPDGRPWEIGIRDPAHPERAIASIPVYEGAVATSGDYERFMIVDGQRYGHILDPSTGWPVQSFASVSVVARHCLVAGTASTIAMLRGIGEGGRWLDDLGLPHLRLTWDGGVAGTLVEPADRAA